nr:hypothetical protein [Tanacetum cinerariifolium]
IARDITACTKSTTEQQVKCRNALNEAKLKKKIKQAADNALRSEVNIGSNEMVDINDKEYLFRDLKSPTRFGPMDIFAILEDPSIMGNKKQIVTDNAANNMEVTDLLKEKRPIIFWTSCATHTINLILEDIGGLPRFKKTLDKKSSQSLFMPHYKTLALMRNFTKKRDTVRPRVTRFSSAFLTLQSLAKKKSQQRHMFSSIELEKYYDMQKQIRLRKFLIYKGKLEKFGRAVAIKGCEVNDEKYNLATADRDFCSDTCRQKNINKNKKARHHEVLLAQEAIEAQEWIVDGDVYEDGVEVRLPKETVSDDMEDAATWVWGHSTWGGRVE